MLVFESLLSVFCTIFGAQNCVLGLIVDHVGLTSVLIWTPTIGKIVKKCRKVLMESITGNVRLNKYNSGPARTWKSDNSCKRNACFQESYLSWKCHQHCTKMFPKSIHNGPKSAKRPLWETKKVPKDDKEWHEGANAIWKLWNSAQLERDSRNGGAKKYINCPSYD